MNISLYIHVYIIQINLSVPSVSPASHRQGLIRNRASSCEICSGRSGFGTGFSPSTSVSPCHYHSSNDLYSSSS